MSLYVQRKDLDINLTNYNSLSVYVTDLFHMVYVLHEKYPSYEKAKVLHVEYSKTEPKPLTSSVEKTEDKATVVLKHTSKICEPFLVKPNQLAFYYIDINVCVLLKKGKHFVYFMST